MNPILRPMTLADIPAGLEFCRESGWNQTPGDWELLIGLAPAGALVAEVDGVVAGTVINVPYRPAFDWIAMMLVRQSLRGQGIGRVLMNAALGMSRGTVKLDATDSGRRLYLTLGFEDEFTLARWRRAPSIAAESTGTARPIADRDWEEIATMDAEAFGADRRRVLRWCCVDGARVRVVAPVRGPSAGLRPRPSWPQLRAHRAGGRHVGRGCRRTSDVLSGSRSRAPGHH